MILIREEDLKRLVDLAKSASNNAYAPYSKYHVGAAVMVENGEIFTGCNIENASYGLTVCAERVAVFNAISKGHRKIKYIAVYAKGILPYPCGACRQVIAEFGDPDTIVIVSDGEKTEIYKLEELLPKTFVFKK